MSHGSNTASREWPMGQHEPYWRTNTSFSPPLSRRWDHRFQSEGLPYGPHNRFQLYETSISSISKESRSSVRGDCFPNHQYSTFDSAGLNFSSSSDSFQTQQWTPPRMQGANSDEYEVAKFIEPVSGPLTLTPFREGTSAMPFSGGSTSSRSDGSDNDELMAKPHLSSFRNFSSRCSFMSKPIHPLSFPTRTPEREACGTTSTGNSLNLSATNESSRTLHFDPKFNQSPAQLQPISGSSDFGATTTQRDIFRWNSASSSVNFTNVSEQFDSERVGGSYNLSKGFKCGLCERFLSQRSPWSSCKIVRSGDMPVAGVLSCCHVFHAECLEETTPKTHKHDPPCPICAKSENAPEQQVVSSLRPWGCGQVGDCVEGALHAPPRNSMLLLNRSRMKKHLSLKSNSRKELPEKKKNGPYSSS